MDITLNNAPNAPPLAVTHSDYNGDSPNAFTTATITMGADVLTIFLPFGGRLTYTNQNKE